MELILSKTMWTHQARQTIQNVLRMRAFSETAYLQQCISLIGTDAGTYNWHLIIFADFLVSFSTRSTLDICKFFR